MKRSDGDAIVLGAQVLYDGWAGVRSKVEQRDQAVGLLWSRGFFGFGIDFVTNWQEAEKVHEEGNFM